MAQAPLIHPGDLPEQDSTLDDLMFSKSRLVIVITAVSFVITAIALSGSASTGLMSQLLGLSAVFGLASALAYRMLERRYLLVQVLWQVTLTLLIFTCCLLFGRAEVIFLVVLLPFIAAITVGWRLAAVAEIMVIGLVVWVQNASGLVPLPEIYPRMIFFMAAFGGLMGWTATTHLTTIAGWALYSFKQARENLEEAREQRLELQQTQEDLSKANQELARLADRLKILQRVTEEARQAKVDFVSNVSHELRTPLNMIIGFTEVITQSPHLYGARLPASLMTDINAIQRNSQHLLSLVNDVLDLSQVEAGHMALSRGWVDPQEIISQAAAVVQGLYDSKGLRLSLEIEDNLPQIFCDQTRVRQVIINLLSNAGRFTLKGGVILKVVLGKECIVVSVKDTGPGIPEEDQKRIFEPFQQLDNSIRRLYGGSGLGLTISKQFIELHGGKMWLESKPGQGTTFSFTLPLSPVLDDEEVRSAQRMRRSLIPGDEYGYSLRTRPSRAPIPGITPRLVVLEKEQSFQRLLRRYLPNTEIEAVQTPGEAAQVLAQSPAQALVVNLPPLEEITEDMTALAPVGTPVISCWIPGEVEAANQLGVIQYLMKPITREKLLSVLEEVGNPGAAGMPEQRGGSHPIKRILVVDDEPDELHLFARMLESAPQGYQVVQVTNGKRALEILRSRKTDILLLDLMMPVMNGFQVLEEMRRDPATRDFPVIVISSRDPQGEAITSNTIRLAHSGGFSTSHLLEIIQTVAEIVTPGQQRRSEDK